MSQPRQPQEQTPEPNQDGGRTEKVMLPGEWNPALWGGWEFHISNPAPQGGVNFTLYARRGEEDDWSLGVNFDADDDRPHLLNPITVTDTNGTPYVFWPDCAEDIQALLTQIGRYGFARPTADGWVMHATVTAAEARAAIAADNDLHLVRRDGFGFWDFLNIDANEVHRIIAEMSGPRQHSIDVMYYAKYNVTSSGARIDQESIRVLRASRTPISSEELDAERTRTDLGFDVHIKTLPIPNDINDREFAAYATEQIRNEPPFDFQAEVIGDDLVIGGVVYDGDVYAPDGEGGVVKKIPFPESEHPNANTARSTTQDTPPQRRTTGPVTPENGRRLTSEERPGTAGTRHAALLPPDAQARRW